MKKKTVKIFIGVLLILITIVSAAGKIDIGKIKVASITQNQTIQTSQKNLQNTQSDNLHPSCSPSDENGVMIYHDGCCEGYTILSIKKEKSKNDPLDYHTLLVDMNGEKVCHRTLIPSPAKMLPDGSIIGGDRYKLRANSCEIVNLTQIDWEGNIVWSFCNWDGGGSGTNMSRQHHDYQREGNPVGYYAPGQEFIPQGKTLILAHNNIFNRSISNWELVDDIIYEIEWNGNLTGFEWHASEHFDEMGFNRRAKHGIRHFPGTKRDGDWLHTNSLSVLGENHWYDEGDWRFHPENIIIDSRNVNIIAIISKENGSIVWKVGPDYSKNTKEGRKLGQIIGQHHAHMIPKGLPGDGNILVFDNGGFAGYGYFGWPNRFRGYSRVIEFNPITLDIVWEYSHRNGLWPFPRYGEHHKFFSWYISSAQRLPNGNTLITEGALGRIFEITVDKEIVWEYITPTILHNVYRAYRVPPEWIPNNPSNYPYWEDEYPTMS